MTSAKPIKPFAQTGFSYTLSLISGKYKMTILYCIAEYDIVRFNEMKRYIGSVSYKTLSTALKELERDGLVHREEFPQIPPKVEYSLTEKGISMIPILDTMCYWGQDQMRADLDRKATEGPKAETPIETCPVAS